MDVLHIVRRTFIGEKQEMDQSSGTQSPLSSNSSLTPLPFDFVTSVPKEVLELNQQFRRGLNSPEGGYLAARAALSASMEILRTMKNVPNWTLGVVQRVHSVLNTLPSEPLANWSNERLLVFFGRLLRASWTLDTCAEVNRNQWRNTVPECGQSVVSSLILQEVMGGAIRWGVVQGSNYGLYTLNQLPGGRLIELTRSQHHVAAQVIPGKEVFPEYFFDADERSYAQASQTPQRYALLKERFIIATAAMALASSRMFRHREPD